MTGELEGCDVVFANVDYGDNASLPYVVLFAGAAPDDIAELAQAWRAIFAGVPPDLAVEFGRRFWELTHA